jgi:hypothetical protein
MLNALINAGLQLDFLHEFPYCFYEYYPFLVTVHGIIISKG